LGRFVALYGVSSRAFCNSAPGRGSCPPDPIDSLPYRRVRRRPTEEKTMSVIQSLGASLPMVLVFFGTLLFSLATAVIALLADY